MALFTYDIQHWHSANSAHVIMMVRCYQYVNMFTIVKVKYFYTLLWETISICKSVQFLHNCTYPSLCLHHVVRLFFWNLPSAIITILFWQRHEVWRGDEAMVGWFTLWVDIDECITIISDTTDSTGWCQYILQRNVIYNFLVGG